MGYGKGDGARHGQALGRPHDAGPRTAYDIAGKGVANLNASQAAVHLAALMATRSQT